MTFLRYCREKVLKTTIRKERSPHYCRLHSSQLFVPEKKDLSLRFFWSYDDQDNSDIRMRSATAL